MAVDKSIRRVDCEEFEHHAVVTFNNPARHNAMSLSMWQQLTDTMQTLSTNDAVRVVVLRGAGERAFVSGADISEFDEERDSTTQAIQYEEICEAADRAVSEFPKPTIACIEGYCIGGGVGLALACDMRICADDAVFNMPAGKLGLGYSYRDTTRLLRVLGQARASEFFYTARRFNAAEALASGIVNKVVEKPDLDTSVREWTEQISVNAPLTLAAFKACAVNWAREDETTEHAAARELIDRCYASDDYRQARIAFAEKRKPVFTGK